MPGFKPFAGIRYNSQKVLLPQVTANPDDLSSQLKRDQLISNCEYNVVSIEHAKFPLHTIRAWIEDEILIQDEEEYFYIYRIDFKDIHGQNRHTIGVFGALELSRPEERKILPHENTTGSFQQDRFTVLHETQMNLSAIWALTPVSGFTETLKTTHDPRECWQDKDGLTHTIWTISDPEQQKLISDALSDSPVIVADGHHRLETALTYHDFCIDSGKHAGGHTHTLAYVVELTDHELSILPIHRMVSNLPKSFDVLEALNKFFICTPADPKILDTDIQDEMSKHQGICCLIQDELWFCRPREESMQGVRELDSSRLDAALAIFPSHHIQYNADKNTIISQTMTQPIDGFQSTVGFFLRPVQVKQILEIAHGGKRMPPKTTFFSPKPLTGIVFRSLRED